MKVVLADYGAGNLRSVCSALARAGAEPVVTNDPAEVAAAPLAIVAGVGHAARAAAGSGPLADVLRDRVAAGRPVFGICVGLQLLFEQSDEGGEGLGLLAGRVRKLDAPTVPHMGWNELASARPSRILDGLDGADVYFAHSYAVQPDDERPRRRPGRPRRCGRRRGRGRRACRRPVPSRAQRRRRGARARERAAVVKKRLIPCLDVAGGRVVKGVRFESLRDVGDPVELAQRYSDVGADELVFLDITATVDGRGPMLELVERAAERLTIPFTVGGGISDLEDARSLLRAGADKVAVNRAAFDDPALLTGLAAEFGAQAVVCAIDARGGRVVTHGGRTERDADAVAWAREAVARGAGELLVTSIDADGTREGYDLKLTAAMVDAVDVPVIASGGAGEARHLAEAFDVGAEAALVASIVHERPERVQELKAELKEAGWNVRI